MSQAPGAVSGARGALLKGLEGIYVTARNAAEREESPSGSPCRS